ncbi:MAG: hypothetical protein LBE13_08595 [Bacteroidales bacterium]|jgi:hypothetical protein|nr:hypothetical protein [Bacteroidales bacterium]
MNLKQLVNHSTDKEHFKSIQDYIDFCLRYLEYIEDNLQVVIISQNENHYNFYQYTKQGNYQITRPINSNLMYTFAGFSKAARLFLKILHDVKNITEDSDKLIINRSVYTMQQSIGATLDALPAGKSNTARKINGDLFEQFIRLIIKEIGINCSAGVVQIPVLINRKKAFDMTYQHDLIIKENDRVKIIGSIKTSSKDRLDKIFIDKFLYNKLTETNIPHIAIFLNDVQRKNTSIENEYGINATFLPGHFKGYSVKLNPLDGVYYCDIRPNMKTETILKDYIKTFDCLLREDIWNFLK